MAVVAAPVAAAFVALAAAGYLAPWPAAVAAAAAIAAIALMVVTHLRRLAEISDYLGRLTRSSEGVVTVPPPSGGAAGTTADLHRAAAEAGRHWSARRRELEAVVAANEAVIASLPDPLIMLDRTRRIVRANQAAESALGAPLAGRDLVAVLRSPQVIDAVAGAFESGTGRIVEFLLPVPVERSFLARVEPLPRPIADGTAALLTLHDITQVKRTDRMRVDFVANASHELRTPLSTLVGFIETLRGPAREDAAARERFLTIMHEQGQRMSRLVADLLSLSRIELNEHTPPNGQVRLGEIIRTIVDGLEFKAAGKQMTIVIDAPPPNGEAATRLDDLPAVSGDDDELTQVFQNLIDNAIKYGRAGATIRIAGWIVTPQRGAVGAGMPLPAQRLDRPAIAVAIMDEGEGIAREHLPRLTERFYRVETARSRELGGTGLGLAIVKHILNRHRGALDIDSTVGVGSTFTVHLPITRRG
ncbi:MAG TPA: ATP-binding protein [Candidatus Acidoferrum sp.]|nr:ATP-binding protein [Candidatus Acidoferrum sp.]